VLRGITMQNSANYQRWSSVCRLALLRIAKPAESLITLPFS